MAESEKKYDVYCDDALIATNEDILELDTLDMNSKHFEKGIAYLKDDYFYAFKGNYPVNATNVKPGIYLKDDKYILIEAVSDEEKEEHLIKKYIKKFDPASIKEALKSGDQILIRIPESSKAFIPPITNDDDILKRALKKALLEKNIDIDQYRQQFMDKNALFNFKQVIKGNAKLSMLLFERGADALKLKYTIIVEEVDPENPIGRPLKSDIVVCSEDTYDL